MKSKTWSVAITGTALVIGLALAGSMSATDGHNAVSPLSFDRSAPGAGLELRVERSDVIDVSVTRALYRSGDLVLFEELPTDGGLAESDKVQIVGSAERLKGLEDGRYSELIEARAVTGQAASFLISRVTELSIEAGAVKHISHHEHGRWLDVPPELALEVSTLGHSSTDEVPDGLPTKGLPNLRNEGITHQAYCGTDGYCSVVFTNTICNRGTGTAWSFAVGGKGWGSPTIWTCTGGWQAQNTSGSVTAGSCKQIIIYGPGYVGPKVRKGSHLGFTGYADIHCQVSESSEADNSATQSFSVGY